VGGSGMSAEGRIRRFIVDSFLFGDESMMVSNDQSLMNSRVMDSTGVMEILMFLEESFGISVGDEELTPDNLDSVVGIGGWVGRKVGMMEGAG